ncbi:putative adhesin/hemagglutinin [Pseudomonas lactis]|uniref:Putative adhesin/hemagglutinin n=1 Tax=Pseudomonas lactis TaxID=1615674 RepID=I4KBM3_9PSED|nr:putative adhesin/hemagglutinin [Pseudomonas lactis]
MADGGHSLSTAVVDKAGNIGDKSAAIDFTVDTRAVEITISNVVDDAGSKKGNLANGDVTDDAKPTLNGKATANSTVNIYDGKVLLGSVKSDSKGGWSFTPTKALAEGAHHLTATVVTAAGGESQPTSVFDLTVDTTAPGKAAIGDVTDDVGDIQGPVANGGFTDDTTPTLSGTGEPGSTVHVYDKGSLLGSVEVDDKGNWSFTPSPLNTGEHSFTVTNEDKAGNVSAPSDAFVVTVDTTAPGKPTIEAVYDDQGDVQGNLKAGDITDDSKPALSGKAEANSTVIIYDKAVEIGRAPTDENGQWTFTPKTPLSSGAHNVNVAAVDKAGNVSAVSDGFEFVVTADGAPAVPAINAVKDDVGSITGELQKNSVTDDARPTVEGTAEAGSTVSVYSNGKLLGTAKADDKGNWSFTPDADLKDGLHNLTATATNAAGNISPQTGLYPITVDTVAPNKAVAELSDDVGAVKGPIVSGDITDDSTPTFTGKAEANSTVVIYDQGTEIGRAPVNDKGEWSFTPAKGLADGGHSLSTAVVDKAGNIGDKSAAIDFTVDTRAVEITISNVVDDAGSKKGNLANGDVTDDAKPTLNGKATANSTVNIYDGKVLLGSVKSDSKGGWSFTPTKALAEGAHHLTATVVTAAGGESQPTSVFDLTVDTTPPSKPAIDTVYDDQGSITGNLKPGAVTDDNKPAISGKAEANSTVVISDNGAEIGRVIADSSGKWTFTPSKVLGDGAHTLTAQAIDAAGNSATSDSFGLTVDTVAPSKPTIETIYDDQGPSKGNLKPGDITDDDTPAISGKAEANSTIEIFDNSQRIGSVKADNSGEWSFTPTEGLSQGLHSLSITSKDESGNVSQKSESFDFTVQKNASGREDFFNIQDGKHVTDFTFDSGLSFKGNGTVLESWKIMNGVLIVDNYSSATFKFPGAVDKFDMKYLLSNNSGVEQWMRFLGEDGSVIETIRLNQNAGGIWHFKSSTGQKITGFEVTLSQTSTGLNVDYLDWSSSSTSKSLSKQLPVDHSHDESVVMADLSVGAASKAGNTYDEINIENNHEQVSRSVVSLPHTSVSHSNNLSVNDILLHGGDELFVSNPHLQATPKGGMDDTLKLHDEVHENIELGGRASFGEVTVAGVVHDVHLHSSLGVELLVQSEAAVNLV